METSGKLVVAERSGARNGNGGGFNNWTVAADGRAINEGAERGEGAAQTTMVVPGRENDPYALWHAEEA